MWLVCLEEWGGEFWCIFGDICECLELLVLYWIECCLGGELLFVVWCVSGEVLCGLCE